MSCSKCGQTPCGCSPAVLSGIQLVNPLISNPTIDGGVINGGTATNLALIGAQIDCTSRGCTAGPGVCNDGIATNAQVCAQVALAISGVNPAFCVAVGDCLVSDPTALCSAVAICISTTPGIIDSTGAFGVNARATTALYGVARYATVAEFNNGNCLLAVDPCTLIAALITPSVSSPFWMAFTSGVCAAGASCFISSNSPVFTGNPTAPTPATGVCNSSIATTQFVCTAITNAISALNPAFCAAVAACAGGGATCVTVSALFPAAGGAPPASTRFLGSDCLSYTSAQIAATGGGVGTGVFAVGEVVNGWTGSIPFPPSVQNGCSLQLLSSIPLGVRITFSALQPNTNYVVVASIGGGGAVNNGYVTTKTTSFVDISFVDPVDNASGGLYFHVAR